MIDLNMKLTFFSTDTEQRCHDYEIKEPAGETELRCPSGWKLVHPAGPEGLRYFRPLEEGDREGGRHDPTRHHQGHDSQDEQTVFGEPMSNEAMEGWAVFVVCFTMFKRVKRDPMHATLYTTYYYHKRI